MRILQTEALECDEALKAAKSALSKAGEEARRTEQERRLYELRRSQLGEEIHALRRELKALRRVDDRRAA